jgi:hypothetical protein
MVEVSGRPGDDTRECIHTITKQRERSSMFAKLHSYALTFKAI